MKIRKRKLGTAKSFYFVGTETFDAATPLRAMAQFCKRHPHLTVLAIGIQYAEEGYCCVTLTVEP